MAFVIETWTMERYCLGGLVNLWLSFQTYRYQLHLSLYASLTCLLPKNSISTKLSKNGLITQSHCPQIFKNKLTPTVSFRNSDFSAALLTTSVFSSDAFIIYSFFYLIQSQFTFGPKSDLLLLPPTCPTNRCYHISI